MADQRKTVLITGCSGSGIGNNLAQVFHQRGLRVFATARNADSISDLKAKGIETLSLVVDNEQSVKDCFQEVSKLLNGKGLDFLVHNAGRNYTVPTTDVEMDEVKLTFATNLFAVVYINKIFLPLVLKARGTIVNIGSVAGVMPFVFGSLYNASKAALHSYSDCLRVELAPFGVHVLTVITGGVTSNIARTKRTLPANSIFRSLAQVYQRRLQTSQELGMDTRKYATQVVSESLNARGWLWNRNSVWLGGNVWKVWLIQTLDWWFPGGLWQRIIGRRFGIPSKMEAPKDVTE